MSVEIHIRGEQQVAEHVASVASALSGNPFERTMLEAAVLVTGDARINAPVDSGQLRASILPDVRRFGNEIDGVVGTKVLHGPFMELGTGVFAGRGAVRMPPVDALEVWAQRHHTSAYVVARAIWMAGGLRPRRYLQRALEQNAERVVRMIGNFVARICRR